MSTSPIHPPWGDPKVGRQRRLLLWLRTAQAAAFIASLAGAVVPGRVGVIGATIAVAAVVAAPLVRVAWLAVRWFRKGDYRFALTALVLLGVIAFGASVA